MQPQTKAIGIFESNEDAQLAGYTVPLTEDEARHLADVPRPAREEALARFRGSPVITKSYVPPRRARDSR